MSFNGSVSTKTVDANSIDQDGNFKFELYYNDPSHFGIWEISAAIIDFNNGSSSTNILQTLSKI